MATSQLDEQAVHEAEGAGLVYTTTMAPGITRKKSGNGFAYYDTDGRLIRDRRTKERINSLVIPPAWTEVWICPDPNGHIQATGRDTRNRKQYIYHPRWRQVRDESKFHALWDFGKQLPKLRQQVQEDLSQRGLPREKVIAAVIDLLDRTFMRIGNRSYIRENDSYGLSTLMNDHVKIKGSIIRFSYNGKRGKPHEIELRDAKLAKIIKKCSDLPGHELFQYVDEDGEAVPIGSTDVNDRMRDITGEDFTAKDIRTWGASVMGLAELLTAGDAETKKEREQRVIEACDIVAAQLGNTRAVCRSSYIYPFIFESYINQTLIDDDVVDALKNENGYMAPQEAALIALIKREVDQRDNGESRRNGR